LELFKVLINTNINFGKDFNVWPKLPILDFAVHYNRFKIVRYLIEELLFDYDRKNGKGDTLLTYGGYYLSKEVLEYLITLNVNPLLTNKYNELPS
jgi:hypothetical protein